MSTTYNNLLPISKRLVFDENKKIKYHYISFFNNNFNDVKTWKIFNPMLIEKPKSIYRFDEKTWKILNFTKWKVLEEKSNTIQIIEAMNW